jgi:hypothetical protein
VEIFNLIGHGSTIGHGKNSHGSQLSPNRRPFVEATASSTPSASKKNKFPLDEEEMETVVAKRAQKKKKKKWLKTTRFEQVLICVVSI